MFRKFIIATSFVVCNFVLFTTSSFAHVDGDRDELVYLFKNKTTKTEITSRLQRINSIIDIEVTDETHERINQYTYYYRRSAESILNKVLIYFPIFEKELRRRGMPDDLKYLAVVESMLNPNATSKSGATGLWQFMKGTAKMVGLEVSSTVDERRSIEKSTQGACDYLQSLYDKFGDWNLAVAAYNCGPGNVSKAIRAANSNDFWEIRKHLPRETQKYLPRFIAAMYLMNFYHHHGLESGYVHTDYYKVNSIDVNQKIDFSKLSEELGLEKQVISTLNPEYLKGFIPSGVGERTLRLPTRFLDRYYKQYEPNKFNEILQRRIKEAAQLEQKKVKPLAGRDTIEALEHIVTMIYSSIQSISARKDYNIPRKMRSRLSFVR